MTDALIPAISETVSPLFEKQQAMARRQTRCPRCGKRRGGNKACNCHPIVTVRSVTREYLRTHPCVDCGETDRDVLEFDHREPKKKRFEVGSAPSALLARREIEKCDVRCANCHRKRHRWEHRIRRWVKGEA